MPNTVATPEHMQTVVAVDPRSLWLLQFLDTIGGMQPNQEIIIDFGRTLDMNSARCDESMQARETGQVSPVPPRTYHELCPGQTKSRERQSLSCVTRQSHVRTLLQEVCRRCG